MSQPNRTPVIAYKHFPTRWPLLPVVVAAMAIHEFHITGAGLGVGITLLVLYVIGSGIQICKEEPKTPIYEEDLNSTKYAELRK